MRTAFPADPALPALHHLTQSDLARITGTPDVEVLRLRHHPGLRAALHVACGAGNGRREGVIWFLRPSKITHLAATRPHLRIDPDSAAAFESFPMDHRLPELAAFLRDAPTLAPHLIGGPTRSQPQLVRYRPGLSATFRWVSDAGLPHFVKVARKADTATHAARQGNLRAQAEGSALTLPAVTGFLPDRGIIAYAAATGESLENTLFQGTATEIGGAVSLLGEALEVLWSSDAPDLPAMTLDVYLQVARRTAMQIADADQKAGAMATRILQRAERAAPALRHVPIHADLKPDHAFLEPTRVTLIDTESIKLGDPDFDRALLDARLDLGPLTGAFSAAARDAARASLRAGVGPDYEWFLGLARLHAAKFLAQRDGSTAAHLLREMLAP